MCIKEKGIKMKTQSIGVNSYKKQPNFKAVKISPEDEKKVLDFVGNKLIRATDIFEDPALKNIWFTLKEMKKARILRRNVDNINNNPDAYLIYLGNQAHRAKDLTVEDCQNAFMPYEAAKKNTEVAMKNAEVAKRAQADTYTSCLKTLEIL